jgi:hypothetical protein
MQFLLKSIMLLFCSFYSQILFSFQVDNNYVSKWAGIEVIGTDAATAEKIRTLDIVTIGSTFKAQKAKHYCEKCKKIIRSKTKFKNAYCGLVWYGDQTAYLTVETEGKQIHNNLLRTIPENQNAIVKIPEELNEVFLKWESRMSALMFSRNLDKSTDSNDPLLHELEVKLSKLVPTYNHTILDVIHYSPDVIERQKAAQLFTWSNHAENLPHVLEWDLLLDPHPGVRNDVARSFSSSMEKIKDEELLKKLMPVYCKQAALPSHTDRNKALYSILNIIKTHPNLISTLNENIPCKKNITYISNVSILENVRDPAKDILKIIKNADTFK